MKLVHFSDVHLGMENYGKTDPKTGLNSRLGDFLKSFDFIVDYAIKNKVDLAIFSGDAYKTRDPSPTYQRAFAQRIYRLSKAGIPVVMITGNHDIPGSHGKANTLEIFDTLKVPNVYVSSQPEVLNINGIQVATLPWLTKAQLLADTAYFKKTSTEINQYLISRLNSIIKNLDSQIDPNKPAILVAHGSVEGAVYGSERNIMIGNDVPISKSAIEKSKFQYTALGHIHKHQVVLENPLTLYAGSIERIDFGEEKEDKGFIAVEIKKGIARWDFIKLPARKFLTIDIRIDDEDSDATATVVEQVKKSDIRDKVVKVVIHCSEAKSAEIREIPIREVLQDANFIAGIIKEVERGERLKTIEGFSDVIAQKTTLDWLREYLQSKNEPSSKIEKLIKLTEGLLDDSDQTPIT